jgi:hypothetical protein
MAYPVPKPKSPFTIAASQPPPLPRSSKRKRFAMRTLMRMSGWMLVAALVVVSGFIAVSWQHDSEARQGSFRRSSVEGAINEAHSLRMLGKEEPEAEPVKATVTAEKPAESEKEPPSKKVTFAAEAPKEALNALSTIISKASETPPQGPLIAPATQEVPALDKWPRNVALSGTPEVRIVTEDPSKGEFVYHTEHFEFSCEAPIGPDAVRHFARVFEATWLLNCQLPLDLKPAPETMRKWFRARILSTDEAYTATGAPEGSGGYYSRADKTIYVPISNLGMKLIADKRVQMERSVESNDTLIHEITHQMMSRWLPRLPVWFSEGSAEYTGIADFVHGRFFLSGMEVRLKNALRQRGAESAGGRIRMPMLSVNELLALEHSAWVNVIGGTTGSENYSSALLLTYFFYHMDGSKDAAGIIAWLRDIEKGVPSDEAARTHLLAGRSVAKLEADLLQAYKHAGIDIVFFKRDDDVFER